MYIILSYSKFAKDYSYINPRNNLKAYITLNKTAFTTRLRNEWRTLLADKRFFDELRAFEQKSQISGISPNLYSNLWISRFSEKGNDFVINRFFKTRVKVNLHQVGPSTQILVTTNFRGNRTLTHVFEKQKEGKQWNLYTECMNTCGWLGGAMVLGSFQYQGVLLHCHIVGQGPVVLAAGAGWVGCFAVFLSSILSFLF